MRRLLLALVLLTACTTPSRSTRNAPEGEPQLAVMTYNVNFGMAGDQATLEAIKSEDVDLILLQETNAAWESLIKTDLLLLTRYPHVRFFHCCTAGGLAVLSKHELLEVEYLKELSWFPALRVVVATPLGHVQALSVHLRPPFSDSGSVVSGYFTTPKIRTAEITELTRSLRSDLPTIIAGDFNEGDGGDAIELLEDRGFATVLPEFHPGADTWRWTTSVGEVSTQLDHIVYQENALEPLDARVFPRGRSDHLPVVARFIAARSPE